MCNGFLSRSIHFGFTHETFLHAVKDLLISSFGSVWLPLWSINVALYDSTWNFAFGPFLKWLILICYNFLYWCYYLFYAIDAPGHMGIDIGDRYPHNDKVRFEAFMNRYAYGNKAFVYLLGCIHLGLLVWGSVVIFNPDLCEQCTKTGLYEFNYIWIILDLFSCGVGVVCALTEVPNFR
jgi:hypothetical protein